MDEAPRQLATLSASLKLARNLVKEDVAPQKAAKLCRIHLLLPQRLAVLFILGLAVVRSGEFGIPSGKRLDREAAPEQS